ncbi:F-box/kelch-repeat protein [Camellia lanceoleosa]|uniref:F-box/kelch-repeat protein n=1 Tax=Camellia lanceoleosa TaxID=1840588 RepID=A0ACC0GFI0_9ERIC|nr:F-box/kelch-repeat protein [Camellia lanceoleosa]
MPIYFRARTSDGDDWYEIKSDDSTTVDEQKNQIMSPIFPLPNHLAQSSTVAVGSRIYVIGGSDFSGEYTLIPESFKDVYYLDTLCPENGWHKTFSMMKPRESCYSIASNGKIYVMGSCAMDEEDPYPWAEVLDTDLGGGGWTPLPEDKRMDFVVTGRAVLEVGNRILVHFEFDPCLYYYNVQDKCWRIYSRDFGVNKNSSAFLDGVLYYVDWTTPGVIYALVVSNGETVPKQVKGLEDLPFDKYKNIAIMNRIDWVHNRYSDDLDFEWVPAERAEGPSPVVNLVSHGKDELAVIWTGLDLWNVDSAVLHVQVVLYALDVKDDEKDDLILVSM